MAESSVLEYQDLNELGFVRLISLSKADGLDKKLMLIDEEAARQLKSYLEMLELMTKEGRPVPASDLLQPFESEIIPDLYVKYFPRIPKTRWVVAFLNGSRNEEGKDRMHLAASRIIEISKMDRQNKFTLRLGSQTILADIDYVNMGEAASNYLM